MTHDYDDIIDLPHHVSQRHPQMPLLNRAAQFAPFAAVAGHDAAIREEERLTEEWIDMGESVTDELNSRMELLLLHLHERPEVSIRYFRPDSRKSGGSYQSVTGHVRRVDEYERTVELTDGRKIAIDAITEMVLPSFPDEDDGLLATP